jgi:hypothetical protein
LLFIVFGISVANLISLACFCRFYVRGLTSHALGFRSTAWGIYSIGVLSSLVSLTISGVSLVWLVIKRDDLPEDILGAHPLTILAIWFGLWGGSGLLQVVMYSLLGLWTRAVLKTYRASRMDLGFEIRAPSMQIVRRPSTRRTNRSFGSQDGTLHSPPRTPVSRGGSTTRRSSATRVGTGSSKIKLVPNSARSSLDPVPFPVIVNRAIDSAFDNWDTSSVGHEIRSVIHSSPPVTRAGLETIPGSRPDSLADALDGPYLPESPLSNSSPHAITSDTATALNWSSSPPRALKSSPPSSPPNFSRPTSSGQGDNKMPPPKFAVFDPSMQDLIHPLFRPNSPHPPPVATAGTTVTASPLADQILTSQSLARLRSNSAPGPGQWRTMPNLGDKSESMSNEESVPDSPTLGSVGSPGPSIVDDADLPPILPGFVLSAGARSSLVGYGKRKVVKRDRLRSESSSESPSD